MALLDLPCFADRDDSFETIHMAQFFSPQARLIAGLRSQITGIIGENYGKLTAPIFNDVVNEMVGTINQIEGILRHDNVRVRDHARLGIPALPNNPQIRKILKRLENSVHVLCLLADMIAGGAATPEENHTITEGEQILDQLLNTLYATFSPPSSGAGTE